jgi:dCTP deaminase
MILKSDRIADLLGSQTEDPLVIVPRPDLAELRTSGAASVDLRLGTWFRRMRQTGVTSVSMPEKRSESRLTVENYVPFDAEFVLHPRAFALAATLEWIRMPSDLAGYVIGKSSWGRSGLIIATATGVHPGFKGCLTLELSNAGEVPIRLNPGVLICQLFLHRVESTGTDVDASPAVGHRKPIYYPAPEDDFAERLRSS